MIAVTYNTAIRVASAVLAAAVVMLLDATYAQDSIGPKSSHGAPDFTKAAVLEYDLKYEENPTETNDSYPLIQATSNPHADWFPDLASARTITVKQSGNWSQIFKSAVIQPTDIILIPAGIEVTYDVWRDEPFLALAVKGHIDFDSQKNTKITLGTLMVYPGGVLNIKPSDETKTEIVFYGHRDLKKDPTDMSVGLLALGGKIEIRGKEAVPFSRISGNAGSATLSALEAQNWQVGGELILSDSSSTDLPWYWKYFTDDPKSFEPFPKTWEKVKIKSISGNKIELVKPLRFTHLDYAAYLERNVVLKSASPGRTGNLIRGHLLFIGETEAVVQNAALFDLGRTSVAPTEDSMFDEKGETLKIGKNPRGRYALHAHFLKKPFIFSGNIVHGSVLEDTSGERRILGSPRFGIVNHASTGEISANAVAGAAGSGIFTEAGVETGSIMGNLVIGTGGGSGKNDDERFGSSQGRDLAHGGFGFWFRGPFLEVADNVAAGYFPISAYGFFFHPSFAPNELPQISGMPRALSGLAKSDLVSRSPLVGFSDNTAVGIFGQAAISFFYGETKYQMKNFQAENRAKDIPRIFLRFTEQVDFN